MTDADADTQGRKQQRSQGTFGLCCSGQCSAGSPDLGDQGHVSRSQGQKATMGANTTIIPLTLGLWTLFANTGFPRGYRFHREGSPTDKPLSVFRNEIVGIGLENQR